MFIVREVMNCKPGKVKGLIERFTAMKKLMDKRGMGNMRVMTDVCAERYWTIVAEFEVESLEQFLSMTNMNNEDMKEMGKIMDGYHDLVDVGRREIYKLEA